ncbi:MAG TPA: hydrogenase maturation protease [Bryobacteraceae bacterium]|nr:hydrogenase maturation protease [Bryobacteraceae bacterium]
MGLGNEILADDAFGIIAAREVRRRFEHELEVVTSSETGFNLLDLMLNTPLLLVVDTIVTGRVKPGTIQIFEEQDTRPELGSSPHFIGLFEVLAAARQLGLPVPSHVWIFAVEAADCVTVGGPMRPELRQALGAVTDWVESFLEVAPDA